MITTKINIKPHLAEYVRGRYNHCNDGPVTFPHDGDLYVVIWDVVAKRPANVFVDTGNLEIVLPSRSVGKRPEYYNYISDRSAKIIEKYIENMLFAELHHELRTEKRKGINYIDTVFMFMRKYDITSISEDAFIKDYYRHRKNELNRKKMSKNNCKQVQ